MNVVTVFAHLSCSDIETSVSWFERLFARAPDARPMGGLCEWHEADAAGMQLFQNAADAGHGAMTVFVRDLPAERARLVDAGLEPGPIEPATASDLVQIRDPDGNLVVLVQAATR